jgi:hypothetical protein
MYGATEKFFARERWEKLGWEARRDEPSRGTIKALNSI